MSKKRKYEYILPNFLIPNVLPFTNTGDAAIIKSMLKQLKKTYPNSEISILCVKPEKDYEFLSKFGNVYGELFRFKRKLPLIIKIISVLFKTLQYFLWTKLRFIPIDNNAKIIFNLYHKADLIIAPGGGYLGGNYLQSIFATLIPMYLAKKLGKLVYYSGITIEPPKGFLFKILTKFVLNRVDLITTREPLSIDVIKSLDIKTPTYLTSDYSFLLNENTKKMGETMLKDIGVPLTKKPIIGINLKTWASGFMSNFAAKASLSEIQSYKNVFVKVIERIIEQTGATIVLFPMDYSTHTDDRKISKEIKLKIIEGISTQVFVISREYQPEQIKSMISVMDAIIGTRFHSILFAFMMKIPFISIGYMQKNSGFMKMTELEDFLIDFSKINTEQIVNSTLKLLNERKYIVRRIDEKLPNFKKQALKNIQFIDELLKTEHKKN